jgi:hypothetical protein
MKRLIVFSISAAIAFVLCISVTAKLDTGQIENQYVANEPEKERVHVLPPTGNAPPGDEDAPPYNENAPPGDEDAPPGEENVSHYEENAPPVTVTETKTKTKIAVDDEDVKPVAITTGLIMVEPSFVVAAAPEAVTTVVTAVIEVIPPPPIKIQIHEATAPGTSTKSSAHAIIDYSNASDGYVMIKRAGGIKGEVIILGPGMEVCERALALPEKNRYYPVSLKYGSGEYKIIVVVYSNGEQFLSILDLDMPVKLSAPDVNYLYPGIYVDYTKENAAVKKSFELSQGASNDLEKVQAIYEYIVGNFKYEVTPEKEQSDYIPDLKTVFDTKKGTCLDLASLMTAMCRAQDIKTKLVFGYASGGYHAWVEVYVAQTGKWERFDPAYALTMTAEKMAALQYKAYEIF